MRWFPRRNPRPTRLALLMAVRDEADIVAHTLTFHFRRGVDVALVADNGSTDGTRDILETFRREGRLFWFDEPDRGYHQSEWMSRLARIAREQHGADWLVCCDADEFWLPDQGDLKDFIARQRAPLLRCERQNQILVESPGAVDGTAFLEQRFAPVLKPRAWKEPCALRAERELSVAKTPGVLFHVEGPKIMVRADCVSAIEQGSHDIVAAQPVRRARPSGLTVRHFPVRSNEQFTAKVMTGGAAYARSNFPPAVGWHWRHWYACALAGQLDAAYARETLREPVGRKSVSGVRLGPVWTAAEALGGAPRNGAAEPRTRP